MFVCPSDLWRSVLSMGVAVAMVCACQNVRPIGGTGLRRAKVRSLRQGFCALRGRVAGDLDSFGVVDVVGRASDVGRSYRAFFVLACGPLH